MTDVSFDSDALKRFRRLTLAARRRTTSSTAGREAFGLRDYAPGDDYRQIDWRLCARRDELLTRVFPPYEDRHTYVLLDCSPSMGLGSPAKFHLACRIAGMLGYTALMNHECLHATAFADGPLGDTGPLRGTARIGRLMRFLRVLPLKASQTDLAGTAAVLVRRCQPHGSVAVISDLYDRRGFREAFDILLHRGYRPRLFHVYAPCEAEPGLLGDVELADIEGGTLREATITEWAAERYGQLFAKFCQSVRDYCRRRVIPLVQVASNFPEDEVLKRVLQHTRNSRLTAAGAIGVGDAHSGGC